MSLSEEVRAEQRLVEVYDLAVAALVTDLGVSFSEAAALILTCAARELTPAAISEAIKRKTKNV